MHCNFVDKNGVYTCDRCGVPCQIPYRGRPIIRACRVEGPEPEKKKKCRGCKSKTGPSIAEKVWSYAKAKVRFWASGRKTVDEDQFAERLWVCNDCPFRRNKECGVCGCPIEEKAEMATEHCPKGLWPGDSLVPSLQPSLGEQPGS